MSLRTTIALLWVDDPIRNLFDVRSSFARSVKGRFERAGIHISPSLKGDVKGELAVCHVD